MAFTHSGVERYSNTHPFHSSPGEKLGIGRHKFDAGPLGVSSIGNFDSRGNAKFPKNKNKTEEIEIFMELMLNASIENFDQIAQDLFGRFGSVADALYFFQAEDAKIDGVDGKVSGLFKSIAQVVSSGLRSQALSKPLISSSKALHDYLRFTMAGLQRETARVLFLNGENRLLADKVASIGSVNHVQIYPREIVKEALMRNATALILVHNHPSGNIEPSKSDILVTEKLKRACEFLELTLHDHLIVSKAGVNSFRAAGLLK